MDKSNAKLRIWLKHSPVGVPSEFILEGGKKTMEILVPSFYYETGYELSDDDFKEILNGVFVAEAAMVFCRKYLADLYIPEEERYYRFKKDYLLLIPKLLHVYGSKTKNFRKIKTDFLKLIQKPLPAWKNLTNDEVDDILYLINNSLNNALVFEEQIKVLFFK